MSRPAGRRSPLGPLVAGVGHGWMHGLRHALAPVDLEPRQYFLLHALSAMPGCSQQAVGTSLAIPRSRMVDLVDGLEARGLVSRVANPDDRRVHALELTGPGRQVLGEADRLAAAYEEWRLAPLDADERARLTELLLRVAGGDAVPRP